MIQYHKVTAVVETNFKITLFSTTKTKKESSAFVKHVIFLLL